MQQIAATTRHQPGAGGQRTVEPVQAGFVDFDPAGPDGRLFAALECLAQALGIEAGEMTLWLALEKQGPEARSLAKYLVGAGARISRR